VIGEIFMKERLVVGNGMATESILMLMEMFMKDILLNIKRLGLEFIPMQMAQLSLVIL